MKTLYMETTQIPAGQTVAQIQTLLGEKGCSSVMTKYDQGEIVAVCFEIWYLDKRIPFILPARWEAIEKILRSKTKKWPVANNKVIDDKIKRLQDQAKRIAWRQILRWIEAQLALVDTEMVKIHEVFLPYMQMDLKGTTLAQSFEAKGFKMLEAPK